MFVIACYAPAPNGPGMHIALAMSVAFRLISSVHLCVLLAFLAGTMHFHELRNIIVFHSVSFSWSTKKLKEYQQQTAIYKLTYIQSSWQ